MKSLVLWTFLFASMFVLNATGLQAATYVEEEVGPSVVVQSAPPPDQVEAVPVSPGPAFFWIRGHWRWNGNWVWETGHWHKRPYAAAVWDAGHWDRRHHEWVWVPGHWK